MEWYLADKVIQNQVVLAPMAGISNPAYMKIVEEMGVGLVVSELISAEAIVRNNKKTFDMLFGLETLNIPVGIQLFGSSAETLSTAAKIIHDKYPNCIIDINMGCPVPKVALRTQAGSALLKSPKKVYEIVAAVVKAVPIPVTVKIRSGWDHQHINAVEIAKECERAGASAVAVHPRTRSQGYTGTAEWSIIRDVKNNVSIPVIGNGDIKTCYDAKRMLEETGCDAVMIGRGALGNPWLIKECVDYLYHGVEPVAVSLQERVHMIKKHSNYLRSQKFDKVALLEMRGHIAWYLKGLSGSTKVKQQVFKANSFEALDLILKEYGEEYYD